MQTSPSWQPLQSIIYGFAIHPLSPATYNRPSTTVHADGTPWSSHPDDEHPALPFIAQIDVGDEVYAFEQLTDQDALKRPCVWYRGYVVSTSRSPNTNSSLTANNPSGSSGSAEEPQVSIAIFPDSYIHVRDELADSEGKLMEMYQLSQTAHGSHTPKEAFPMETLREEEEGSNDLHIRESSQHRRAASPRGPRSLANSLSIVAALDGVRQSDSHPHSPVEKPTPPRPALKSGDDTASGHYQPIVDEIASALREWHSLLFVYLSRRDYKLFAIVKEHLDALHLGRRQLLSETLSAEETLALRRECVARLVRGNVAQGLDVIVRHPAWGSLATVDVEGEVDPKSWMSAVRVYAMQVALAHIDSSPDAGQIPRTSALYSPSDYSSIPSPQNYDIKSLNIPTTRSSFSTPAAPRSVATFYHISLDVKAFVASPCAPGETAELFFSLYSKSSGRFLTEEFCAILNHNGVLARDSMAKVRTLFRDLSLQDIQDSLYLVCRILRHGAMKLSSMAGSGSYMRSASTDLRNVDEWGDVVGEQDNATSKGGGGSSTGAMFRRPFGCAVLELSQFTRGPGQLETSAAKEHVMPIFVPINEASFSTLHQDLIAGSSKDFEKSPRAEMIAISTKVFRGDASTVIKENPTLLQDAAITARLGFPDVVFPGDERNEVYIKLWSGEFNFSTGGTIKIRKGVAALAGSSIGPSSVEVTVEIRTRTGQVIDDAIYLGTGEPPVSLFRSMILYRNNTPTYGELLKLRIPPEMMENCHMFFTFRLCSSKERSYGPRSSDSSPDKPFAYAYLPLFTDTRAFLEDGSHNLVLYRADKMSQVSSRDYYGAPAVLQVGHRPEGLIIPANLSKTAVPIRDAFTIRSFLCSTRFTSNSVLLGLLNWELLQDKNELLTALSKFTFVGEVEIVKFLRDIFDSLFAILVSSANQQGEMDDLVFNALVTVLGIVQDRRFNNFQPVLDVYIAKHFSCASASYHIIHSMNRLLVNPTGPETAPSLRAALKVWHYIFKFIVRARELQKAKDVGLGATSEHIEANFKREIWSHLSEISRLMTTTTPTSVIGAQTIALQHFSTILPDLADIFNKEELVTAVSGFANASSSLRGKLVGWKLMMYLQLVKGFLYDSPESRTLLTEAIVGWIKPYFGHYDEFAEQPDDAASARDSSRTNWIESTRLCITILAVMLDKLQQCLTLPAIVADPKLLRQEQENVEYLLQLIPRILDSYREQQSPAMIQALSRHRSTAATPSTSPVVFPGTYPFALTSNGISTRSSVTNQSYLMAQDKSPRFNSGLADTAVVLMVLVLSSPRKHLVNFFEEFAEIEGRANLSRLLQNLFHVSNSILQNEAFPANWLNVNVLAHKVLLKMSEPVAFILLQRFIPDAKEDEFEEFDSRLWHDGLAMVLKLLASDQLVIEEFSPQKRRAVWRLANDIRGEGAGLLFELWQALGWPSQSSPTDDSGLRYWGYHLSMMDLVELVLNLCLSHHDQLRTNAVHILYSMIIAEYQHSGNFSGIESELVSKLDKLFMSDTRGDDITRAYFILQLRHLFDSPDIDEQLKIHIDDFLNSVDLFLDLLLSIRELPEGEEYQDDRVIATLRLMNFIRRIGKDDMYIRYVHQLVNMHLQSQNFVEAALTLKLHSDLHEWDLHTFVEPMPELDLPRQSQFVRKETLCLLILDYLGKGKAWESAIEICKELATQHSEITFNYQRLSEILMHQASLLESIVTEPRYYSEYFRVAFYGNFPNAIRDKHFIYRGYEWEKLGAFCERMLNKHPGAHLIKGSLEPSDEIKNSSLQYIQCSSVTPEPNRTLPIFTNPDVPPAVKQYYEHSAVNMFSSMRRFAKRNSLRSDDSEFRDVWVERTYFTTEESFPTVLRRSEIVEVQVVEVSPIENALSDVEARTAELHLLEMKYSTLAQTETSINTNQLASALNNVVDTPEDGGIRLYRQAFLGQDYLALNPDQAEVVPRLRLAIEDQVRVIARCLALHSLLCLPEMRPFHVVLDKFFRKNFEEEVERLHVDTSTDAISPISARYGALHSKDETDSLSPRSPILPTTIGQYRPERFDSRLSIESSANRNKSVLDLSPYKAQTLLQRNAAHLTKHGLPGLNSYTGDRATLVSEPSESLDLNGSILNVTNTRETGGFRGGRLSRRLGSLSWRNR